MKRRVNLGIIVDHGELTDDSGQMTVDSWPMAVGRRSMDHSPCHFDPPKAAGQRRGEIGHSGSLRLTQIPPPRRGGGRNDKAGTAIGQRSTVTNHRDS
ncbi:MAG TPA: hypothetical protein VK543_18400 [Puia sp.]|nr:hypothetical protein [Puia sp.]